MEPGETPRKQPETLWLPKYALEVPEELHIKHVIAISFPETPEERRAAWVRPSGSTGKESVGWVGMFAAEYTDRRGYVVFVASGSSEDPDTGAVLAFSDSEWEAFVGGARQDEFDRRVKSRRPRTLGIITLLALISAGPMLGRSRLDDTAV